MIEMLLLLAALAGGLAAGSSGFGFYLILGPALWLAYPPTEAIAVSFSAGLPPLALAWRLRAHIAWRHVFLLFCLALPGAAMGLLLHTSLPGRALLLAAGISIILALLSRGLRGRLGFVPAGILSGTLTTSVGYNGPPISLAFAGREEKVQRSSTIATLALLSLLGSFAIFSADSTSFWSGYKTGLLLLPASGLGVYLGHRVALRLGRRIEVISVLLSLGGAALLLADALF